MTHAGLRMTADNRQVVCGRDVQEGAMFGSGFTVPKIRAMASAGRKLA